MTKTNTILFTLFILSGLAAGMLAEYLSPNDEFAQGDLPILIISVIVIFYWYHTDSNKLNYKRPLLLNILVIAFSILAIPYYLYKTRGFKKGSVAILIFIVINIAYTGCHIGGKEISNYLYFTANTYEPFSSQ